MKSNFLTAAAFTALFAFASAPVLALDAGVSGTVGGAVGTDTGVSGTVGGSADAKASNQSSGAGVSATGHASGSLTVDNVDRNDPFGDLDVDMSGSMSSDLTVQQQAEVRDRCEIIVNNKDRYEASTSAWCEANVRPM